MLRPGTVLAALAAVVASCAAPPRPSPDVGRGGAERPNVIVLVTDDQRADALSAAGNAVLRTPELDRLAGDGTRFENGFVTTSICMTSRASILTGQYARRHRIDDFGTPLSREQLAQTYPARFRAAGYFTGFVGKWGLGGALPDTLFDVWHGFGGQGSYRATDERGGAVHLTRLLERQAVDFLERAAAQDAPFLLAVSFKAPHVEGDNEFVPDSEFDDLYADATVPPPADTAYVDTESLPAFGFALNPREEGRARWRVRFGTDSLRQANVKRYYRLVNGVDRAVGEIRAALERLGLAETTVVVFLSDNGFFLGEHGLAGKWYGHQESIRVPFLVYDPRVPAAARGQVRDEIALNIDVAPTVLDLAGLATPPGVQGRSLAPLVRGGAADGWRTDFFYEHRFGYDGRIPVTEGVVGQRYKYLRYPGATPPAEALFDTVADPMESDNLVNDPDRRPALADTLRAMRARWAAYREALR